VTLAAGRPAPSSGATNGSASSALDKNPEIQGVFVVRDKRAVFVPVATGITGVTDIEVVSGLQEGDQIITGSYKTLRTLKPDARVKVDNSTPKVTEEN
jgi:HlyD family secretion protein